MIPGRGVALATTMTIVAIVVVVPLSALVLSLHGITPAGFIATAFSPRSPRTGSASARRSSPRRSTS
jgi:ABC-type sulfate transport system permease component